MPPRRSESVAVQASPDIYEAGCIVRAVDPRQFVDTAGLDR